MLLGEDERRAMEDALPGGACRPPMLLGVPMLLIVPIGALGYLAWVNIGGWRGLTWAAALVIPALVAARLLTAHDVFGINVLAKWLATSGLGLALGETEWGGTTRSPLPASERRVRGMRHA